MDALNSGGRGAAAYNNIEAERMRGGDTSTVAELQGEGAIKTWSFDNPDIESLQVRLFNEGLPIEAVLDLWQGPNHTPTQAIIYSEDGNQHPLLAKILLMQRSNHGSHTIGLRNTAPMTFPCTADVGATTTADPSLMRLLNAPEEVVQGGALHTFTLDPYVDRVRVLIKNDVFGDGRPLHARIELLQGPNNKKQVMEVYTDDGPFFCEMETPGSGFVVRVVNISPIEFPLGAVVETFSESGGNRPYNGRNSYGGGNGYRPSDRSRYDTWGRGPNSYYDDGYRGGRGGGYGGSSFRNGYGRGGGYGSTYGDSYYGNRGYGGGGYGSYGNSLYNGARGGTRYGGGGGYYNGGGGYSGGYNNRYGGGGFNRYNNGGYYGGGGYGNRYNNNGYGGYNNRGYGGYGGYNNGGYGGYNNSGYRGGGNFANRFMRNNNDIVQDNNYNRRWYD